MAEQFSRLRLTSKYVKITSEEDIKQWASTSDDAKCTVCKKKTQFRDSFELDNEFVARFQCENHKKKVHFSFKFPKKKAMWTELKTEDEPTTISIKVPRKKRETKKKTVTTQKKTNDKKTTGNNSKKATTTKKKPTSKKNNSKKNNSKKAD